MKKILSSIAILATVFGMTSAVMAKTFPDVKNTKYEESVDILSELKIIDGYDDNTYKPNNSVKRSEMAKLLIVALGQDSSAKKLAGSKTFNDVSTSYWASGYIALASNLGLIKGYPDGTFKPEETVSYVEAATMLLRALDYGKELDDLEWPKGYMTKADSAGLLENVSDSSSSTAAIRGNVATMLLNTLKANTRKVVATNDKGPVYGNSTVLIEKTFSNLVFVDEGTVTNINIDDMELTVKDEKNNRTIKIIYDDDTTIKKMFGREVSFIYDKEAEELLTFKFIDDKTVETIDVFEIDEVDDIIIDVDDYEYDLPKSSNILMIGASNYSEVEKAYLTYDSDDEITHVVLEGIEDVHVGIVIDSSVKIDGEDGIEIINVEDKYEELVLASTSTKIYVDDIILYTYNKDDEIVIKSLEDIEDSIAIESVSSTSIKLKNEDKLTFSSSAEYQVYLIDDLSYISTGKLTYIDPDYDKATIVKIGDVYHILVFVEAVDIDDVETTVSVSTAKKELKAALTTAKSKSESRYSIESYENLKYAIEYGQMVYDSYTSYSSARIQLATKDINTALSELKTATTSDKNLRNEYEKLQDEIKVAEALKESDYTSASYKALSTALTAAKKIVIENTTEIKVKEATSAISSAINLLVTNASNQQVVKATNRINIALGEAKNIRSSDYTSETYKELTTMVTLAEKALKTTNISPRELENVADNIETALDNLVPVQLATYQREKTLLDNSINLAESYNESAYTTDSWEKFETLYTNIKSEYDALDSYSKVKAMTNEEVIEETEKVTSLNTRAKNALNLLVLKTDDTSRRNSVNIISKCLAKANSLYPDKVSWEATNPGVTWGALQTKLTEADDMIENTNNYTTSELKAMEVYLTSYIVLD